MKREEKIDLLNKLLEIEEKNDIGNLTRAERREFQQWISEALEQESCDKCVYSTKDGYCQYDDIAGTILPFEPCEDAISREPFTDSTICEGFSCEECSFNRKDKGGCILEERVMKLPPVTPQPKTGHWINIDATHSQCDRCGAVFEIVSANGEANYCPNCSAKMQEEEE